VTQRLIETTWAKLEVAAALDGRPFPARSLCRLIHWSTTGSALHIAFGPTDYRELMGTNRLHPTIVASFGRDFLSNAMGVCSVVVTADNHVVIQQRRTDLLQYPGWYHVCGGMLEPAEDGGTTQIEPFACLLTELREELGIEPDTVATMRCLGIAEDRRTHQPELLCETILRVPASRFARLIGAEHENLVILPNTASQLSDFLIAHRESTVPVGMACLAVFGKQQFGPWWYHKLISAISVPVEQQLQRD
jgi:8-oxo-dGTP pyrophosphatase MutT (NUDIX family)